MQQSIFVGLDLGSSHFHQTVINADGEFVSARSIPTSEFHLRTAFANLSGNIHVHLEASELAPWVYSIISPLVAQVVVSHPRSLKVDLKDSIKDDAIDARKLAELLRLNQVYPVYYETLESRCQFKHLVTHYEQLAHDQARLKAKMKARLRTLGIIRQDSHLFSKAGKLNYLIRSVKRLSK